MKKVSLKLNSSDREQLSNLLNKGNTHVRTILRAQILLSTDRGASDREIVRVLGVERTRVWRVRQRYLEGGLERAIYEQPRSGRPRKYDETVEAEIIANACTQPPLGQQRWTLALLKEVVQRQCQLSQLSDKTVGRVLKKHVLNLGASKCGVLES